MKQKWYTDTGTLDNKYAEEFDRLVQKLKPIIKKLEGRVTYRDLYDIARDVSIVAVAALVTDRVIGSRPPSQRKKAAPKKKRKNKGN